MQVPIIFNANNELIEYFQNNGTEVGPRRGSNKRTQDEKEMYNLRQYLLTLESKHFLKYPIKIEIGESPDFILEISGQKIGLEVTEATTEEWQKHLTDTEKELEGKKWGSSLVSLGRGDGWVGDSPERETCAAILNAIQRKIEKIKNGHYKEVSRQDILIYVNVKAFFYSEDKVATMLNKSATKLASSLSTIGNVHVITSSKLIIDATSEMQILPLATVRDDF